MSRNSAGGSAFLLPLDILADRASSWDSSGLCAPDRGNPQRAGGREDCNGPESGSAVITDCLLDLLKGVRK